MRIAASIVIVAAAVSAAAAQPTRVVRGVVVRDGTPTPISGASVLTERGEIAITDIDGYFAIAVTAKDRDLTIVATGYTTRTIPIGEAGKIELAPASGAEVIEVRGKAPEQTKPVSYGLAASEIVAIPGAGNDILRAATVLPGVARIPFSFGGLVLRGTSPRDTAVYLDGVEVPIAFHFGGITSFYPSGMLSDLTVTAGGYDASYGRAAGGLVTLTTREPRTDRWRMGGSIGLFDSSIMAEGPWRGGGLIVGVRRSYLDQLVDPFLEEDAPLPSYWDFQLRTTFGDTRKRGRISPMIFGAIDRVASQEVALTSMFIRIAAPYTRHKAPFTFRLTPWLGLNQLSFSDKESEPPSKLSRPFYPGGVRSELVRDYAWGHLRGGVEFTFGFLDQLLVESNDEEFGGNTSLTWTDVAWFGELHWKLDGERFAIKPGLRIESFGLSGQVVVGPRVNISQRLGENLTLRQSIGRFHQPPIPGDVDPETANPKLEGSYTDQISLGIDTLLGDEITMTATGFFNYGLKLGVKTQNPNDIDDVFEPDFSGLGPTFELLLEKQLGFSAYRENKGRARSYGIELLLKRNVGRLFTLLSYTLQKAERTEDPAFYLGWRPFELDQRHNLQLAASIQLKKWRFGARLQLVTGNPYTIPPVGTEVEVPYAARLPLFYTIDLRADRRWHRCWGDIVFYIDIQNATNHRNIEGRELFIEFDDSLRSEDIRGLPIIPFLGVEFRPLI